MADQEPELAAAAGRVGDGAPTAADDAAKVDEEFELVEDVELSAARAALKILVC
jgi:hypothetical protein